MAISDDGKTAAVAGADGTIRLWEPSTGKQIRTWSLGVDAGLWSLALTPNGKILAAGTDEGVIRLRDVGTGKETRVFAGHQDRVAALMFGPDNSTLASAAPPTIRRSVCGTWLPVSKSRLYGSQDGSKR